MLKRFMNWLLNRVQSLLGITNGRRSSRSSSSRESEASSTLRDRINHLSQQARPIDPNRPIDPLESAIPFAERAPLIVSTEPLPEPADEPSSAAEDRAGPIAAAEKKVGKLTDFDASTQRHLDVAATALSDDISVKPAFPTEASELVGSPSSDDIASANGNANENAIESISTNLSLRSLKKISDDQLPAIHDLLPAIEAPTDGLVSSSAHSALASEQAVLFSFDIVESEAPAAESPVVVEQSSDVMSSDVMSSDASSNTYSRSEPSDPESEVFETISEAINDSCTTKLLVPSAQILTDDEVPANLPETTSVSQSAEKLTERTASTEAFPYPWLLPAPQPESQIESDAQAASSASAFADTSQSFSSDSQLAETANESRPVKNGVVKLLFTLKEGNFHGYVTPDDGTKDILFHQKYINADIFSQLERGTKVAASVKYVEGKAYATHLKLL